MSSDLDRIKEYYGQTLKTSADLKTGACCAPESLPKSLRARVERIHPEVRERFFGCGSPIPPALEGRTVLDLGCGSGRDVYLIAQLVGPKGQVIGVDMTPEQLAVARKHEIYHARELGYPERSVRFVEGYIEDLAGAGIESDSVDVVISNCVFNLSPDKERLFSEVFRVLRKGGELYFSDVFADRRIPKPLLQDAVLRGECLAGAHYTEDFRRMLAHNGCLDFRVVSSSALPLFNDEIQRKVGGIQFFSKTIRAFKLDVEDRCEDYGQIAYYRGGIADQEHFFTLDDHHRFEKDRPFPVCSNTAAMLMETRYKEYFHIQGDLSTHFGLFDCSPTATITTGPGACC